MRIQPVDFSARISARIIMLQSFLASGIRSLDVLTVVEVLAIFFFFLWRWRKKAEETIGVEATGCCTEVVASGKKRLVLKRKASL